MDTGRKAVFVDRDGTLNDLVYDETHGVLDSPRRPEQVRLVDGAADFLKGVRKRGFLIVCVTNQPGIAKGTISIQELQAVNRRLSELLNIPESPWDDLRYCPHYPEPIEGGCADYIRVCHCRKPKPGLLLDAARERHIQLTASWMVGDGLNDIQAGRAAGCRTILLTRLKLEQAEQFFSLDQASPDWIARDLFEALEIIARES